MSGTWRVFVRNRSAFPDHRGDGVKQEASRAGLKGVREVRSGQAYELSGGLPEAEVRRLAEKLLADPVTQEAEVAAPSAVRPPKGARLVQIWPKNGVSDPAADTVRLAAKDLGVRDLEAVRSGHVFGFHGAADADAVKRFCEERLMNALVQRIEIS